MEKMLEYLLAAELTEKSATVRHLPYLEEQKIYWM